MKREKTAKGKLPLFAAKLVLFLLGLVVLSMGAVSMMKAALGASSWDVLHIGLSGLTGLSVGLWVQIVGILMVGIACILDRRLPQIGSVANILLIGFFVNIFLASSIIPVVTAQWARFVELVVGIVLMGIGSGMYVASRLGSRSAGWNHAVARPYHLLDLSAWSVPAWKGRRSFWAGSRVDRYRSAHSCQYFWSAL